jgi:hypothetical protein
MHLSRHRKAILFVEHTLRPGDGERSKDVWTLAGASKAALPVRSQKATVDAWLKSARQSGSSDGLRVSVI